MKNTVERYWELTTSASTLNSCSAAKSAVFNADRTMSTEAKKNFLRYAATHLRYAHAKIFEELTALEQSEK